MVVEIADAVPRPHPGAAGRPGRARPDPRRRRRAGPRRGRCRRWRGVYDRVGFLPGPALRLAAAVPMIGVVDRIPAPYGDRAAALAGVVRRPAGRLDPDARHPAAADRGAAGRARRGPDAPGAGRGQGDGAVPDDLRGTGTFRPVSPVVFVQVAGGIAECEQLERAIRGGPLHRDLAFHYHPHVTVAHHVDEAAMDRAFEDLAGYTCTFEVRGVPPLRARHRPGMARRARLLVRGRPEHEDAVRR